MWTITTYRKSGRLFILRVMPMFRQQLVSAPSVSPASLTRPVPLPTLVIPRRLQRRGICFSKLHRINIGGREQTFLLLENDSGLTPARLSLC
jgi:hypothetical protein